MEDSATDNFQLKISATPPRAVALRPSNLTPSRNDTPLECLPDILADHGGPSRVRTFQ